MYASLCRDNKKHFRTAVVCKKGFTAGGCFRKRYMCPRDMHLFHARMAAP